MKSLLFQISTSFFIKSTRSLNGQSLLKPINLKSSSSSYFLTKFQCYSSKRSTTPKKSKKMLAEVKNGEKDAFFVVRKGDVVGVYKNLSECQAQVGSLISDPPVSVYKGYNMPKDAEEHLRSYGLHNALYTIKASDLKDDLFGTLEPCLFQEPSSSKGEKSGTNVPPKRLHDQIGSGSLGTCEPISTIDSWSKLRKLEGMSSDNHSCTLEFDGASKGNPGLAGAGAVLRALNGNLICKIRQGLGIATNNVAEYRAIILGLKKALEMGYTSIHAQGDSKLVCMQILGQWKVKNQNMSDLHAEATKLKDKFSSFQINHVLRELNSAADAQANLAVTLADGQVQEDLC